MTLTSKPDLANHVPIYTGRLFYDGSYTDEQRWVKAEALEALHSRLSDETTDDLTVQFPRAWAPYLQAVILGAIGDFDGDGDCRWHLNELAKFLGRAASKTEAPHQ